VGAGRVAGRRRRGRVYGSGGGASGGAEPGRPPPVLGHRAGVGGAPPRAAGRDGGVLRGAGPARPASAVARGRARRRRRRRRGGGLRRRQRHVPAQRTGIVRASYHCLARLQFFFSSVNLIFLVGA